MTRNLVVSELIINRLIQLGVQHFVVSPGSRSTPLTVAVARNTEAHSTVHFDERGAAYFSLGHAKATGNPTVLICTSGTAVANYFPAVVEASMDNIPMIILSADRPPELIDVGANQAIFQENIYGNYPRLFKNLAPPDTETAGETIFSDIDEVWAAATGSRPGPVHLNCQFREPLLPESDIATTFPKLTEVRDPSLPLQPSHTSTSSVSSSGSTGRKTQSDISAEQLSSIITKIESCTKGLIVVGRSVDSQSDESILNLAQSLNWPVLADVQSKLRFQKHSNLINHFDLALLKDDLSSSKPEMVIHLGGAFTSKRLLTYLNDQEIYYVAVKSTPERVDPNHQIDLALQMNVGEFCSRITNGFRQAQPPFSDWLSKWQKAENEVSASIDQQLSSVEQLNEPGVSYHLSKLIPQDHSLMLASSMAIREMEMFASPNSFTRRIIANRGTSGIDGLIATAAGYQTGSKMPLTFLMGDLAALHDLNSLSLVNQASQPIVIVLINNNGGGIFNFLPVLSEEDVFEPYFGTPHGWTFEKAAAMFDLEYTKPKDTREFRQAYTKAVQGTQSTIIEIQTDRYENHELHKNIFKVIRES